MSRARLSADAWRRIIQEQQASGRSVAAFCRQARISQVSFYAWRRRLRDAENFVEVQLPSAPAAEANALELRLPGGRGIIVRAGFDARTLRELLRVLEADA